MGKSKPTLQTGKIRGCVNKGEVGEGRAYVRRKRREEGAQAEAERGENPSSFLQTGSHVVSPAHENRLHYQVEQVHNLSFGISLKAAQCIFAQIA